MGKTWNLTCVLNPRILFPGAHALSTTLIEAPTLPFSQLRLYSIDVITNRLSTGMISAAQIGVKKEMVQRKTNQEPRLVSWIPCEFMERVNPFRLCFRIFLVSQNLCSRISKETVYQVSYSPGTTCS